MNNTPFVRIASILFALIAVGGSTARGQVSGSPTSTDRGQCVAGVADTAYGFVHGFLEPESSDAKLHRETLAMVLANLSATLVNDTLTFDAVDHLSDIHVVAFGLSPSPKPMMMPRWVGHPALVTEIAVTLNQHGALSDPKVVIRGDSAVAATLVRGITAAPTIADAALERPQRLRLRLTLSPDSASGSAPLIAVRQLRAQGTEVQMVSGIGQPRSPRTGLAATVLAWYVVDAKGSAVPASFVAAPAADPSLAREYQPYIDAVRRAAPTMRHEPATTGGCPIARRGLLTVKFTAQPRPLELPQ